MTNLLAAIGRAQPATAIQDFQLRQGNILGQEKKRAVADLQMKSVQQDINIKQRQEESAIKAEEDALRPIAIEPLLNSFEGGPESPMAQMVYEDAVSAGLIDLSQGGMGTINQKTKEKIKERITDPTFAAKLSRTRIDYWRGLLNEASQAVAEKPDDEKLQAELQRVTDGLNQSLGQDKAMSDAVAAQEKELAAIAAQEFKTSERIAAQEFKASEVDPSRLPTTAMGQFIKQNPNATLDDLTRAVGELSAAKEITKGESGKPKFAPTTLSKLISERQAFIDSGMTSEDNIIKAYDNKISGSEIDIEDMTPEEIRLWGNVIRLTGKVPSVGRGKQATKTRIAMLKSAAKQELEGGDLGLEGKEKNKEMDAALAMIGSQADTKAMQGSLNFLDKQLSSMGSFVTNLNSQIDRVSELSRDLKTFDARILNLPLRAVRGRLIGTPLQTKYDLFLTEIENETTKLASNATASIAAPSVESQKVWARIHDKNLSVKDMLEVLDATREAANFRVKSIEGQLNKTRERIRTRDFDFDKQGEAPSVTTQEEYDKLPSGATYLEDGVKYRKP